MHAYSFSMQYKVTVMTRPLYFMHILSIHKTSHWQATDDLHITRTLCSKCFLITTDVTKEIKIVRHSTYERPTNSNLMQQREL